jgi:SAM-dependent methyltransferase
VAAEEPAVDLLETALTAFYDQDALRRAGREVDPHRVRRREVFADLLAAEGRGQLLEIGTGPGRDASAFLARGLSVSGVDLSPEHVRLSRAAGIDAHVASVRSLPFPDDAFDAGWTMSTLLHVPNAGFDAALREIRRVLVAGSPLAVGVWGGIDAEETKTDDEIQPQRFFSLRSDERLREMLGRHGQVERFETWAGATARRWAYQWCVLRVT